ncbi:MFS transporter [Paenarthrobacter sp. JL.01a]|uniref:MFS transporter n=1 Tax=Paenarthrobacter sp. JL.01a TaxID=2979324 RepID=UPI0021CA9F10|nr:MFS transporter [Paenarthrobacter sp. JL.01a]UXM92499.1 MFS transporter [Paenarthrobacter sp. JL.01a]
MNDSQLTQLSPTKNADTGQRQQKRKNALGTGLGNALEFYDWTIYATFTPFFATQLFNNADPLSAVLSTLGVFAIGFLARPLGGFVFGWIGDRVGRKTSMSLTVGLAAVGSLLIGVAPTFATVGAWASVVLVCARVLQGLAHGGELPSAQTFISEVAPREKRGLWSSLIYVSATIGVLFGTLLGAVLTVILSKQDMLAWGWRLPFLLGGVFGLYALVMRMRMSESETFANDSSKARQSSMWREIVKHRKQAIQIVGIGMGGGVAFYVWSVAAPVFASTSLGIDPGQALWAGVGANVVFLAALPLWGKASDRFGRKPILWISFIGAAIMFFPMTWLLRDSAWQLFISMSVMLFFIAANAAIVPAFFAEMFPTGIRTVGVAVPYSIQVAIFGGTAPYLQTWLNSTVGPVAFTVYAVTLLLIAAAVIITVPETKAKDLSQGATGPEM